MRQSEKGMVITMKHKLLPILTAAALLLSCTACTSASGSAVAPSNTPTAPQNKSDETIIVLADSGVTVDGAPVSSDPASDVYTGAAIVYYEDGKDDTYGAGVEGDAHTAEEAAAHTVVTITQPGTYRVSGQLAAGQLAVDLGETASADPSAVVTLILDGANITCTVAPAVLFYNVYECGSTDVETATATVDTSAAGANVILADGSVNTVNGSYVAKIYREGTDKKLHKYDGAFYSKMSMNLSGESEGTGELHITAANEGLDTELHLTINSGKIWIEAQNDGINTNEDGVSVTTINGGTLVISAGLGAEGDGIDSNGYLVVNGGEIVTLANGGTGDGGLDSDQGIYLNGGSVLALGSRNDEVEASSQTSLEFHFSTPQKAGSVLTISDPDGNTLLTYTAERDYQSLIYSTPELNADTAYTVSVDGTAMENSDDHMGGPGGGRGSFDGEPPTGERPADRGEPPEGFDPEKDGQRGQRPSAPPDGTPITSSNPDAA